MNRATLIAVGSAVIFLFGAWAFYISQTDFKTSSQPSFPQNNVQTAQKNMQRPRATSILSFSPSSIKGIPLERKVGETVPLEIMLDPKTNKVTSVDLVIRYDPTKLNPIEAGAFKADGGFPTVVKAPIYSPGKITVTVSVGADLTKAATQKVKLGTVTFKTLAATPEGATAKVGFGRTRVHTIGSKNNPNRNMLKRGIPTLIVIK